MNNISILEKSECCGCTACFSSCPTKAISMKPDYEGFIYPQIDQKECIDCGICLKVCKDVSYYKEKQKIYACWDKEDNNRSISSSGGIFSALANLILDNGGYVCAVGYSEDCKECLHKIISSKEQLDDLRRAKFVQSKKYDIFTQIKDLLKTEKQVLFCGTPCEVGGLRQFLRKDYGNLLTCDLICGCVSSPEVYKTYIDFLNEKYHSEAISVNFKDKRKGWRGKAIAVKFRNGEEYYNSILDDDYCVSFHSRYNIRPSCFNCKYRNLQRVSDITLGDFWGIEKYVPEYDDNKGTSFVLANTKKGDSFVNKMTNMNIHFMDIDYEHYSITYNWCMHKNPWDMPTEDRNQFYQDVKNMPFDQMAQKDLAIIKEERKRKKLNIK
jgi:Coenzyme F420-reducing hydrogenase, beta subunit